MRTLTAVSAMVLLGACGPGDPPTGKRGVLFFEPTGLTLAVGLHDAVRVPSMAVSPGGKLPLPSTRVYTYDLDDVTIEARGPGIELRSATAGSEGWVLELGCVGPNDFSAEVVVTARAPDGTVRYEDALSVLCLVPEAITAQTHLMAPWPWPVDRVVEGASLGIEPRLTVKAGAQTWSLGGRGLRLAGPLEADGELGVTGFQARAARPGRNPTLHVGDVSAEFPLEVLAKADVTPELDVQGNVGEGKRELWGLGSSSGQRAYGLTGCVFEIEGETIDAPECHAVVTSDGGTACVTWNGHRACAAFP